MKAVTLSAMVMSVALAFGTTLAVTDAEAYKGGSARGYSGKGCGKGASVSRSSSVRGPGVSRSVRDRGADANFGGGSAAMAPNRSGNGRDR
jgi:hypothetical protein